MLLHFLRSSVSPFLYFWEASDISFATYFGKKDLFCQGSTRITWRTENMLFVNTQLAFSNLGRLYAQIIVILSETFAHLICASKINLQRIDSRVGFLLNGTSHILRHYTGSPFEIKAVHS